MKTPYSLNRPKGLADYCLNMADNTYIIFDKESAYCTSCRKFVKLKWTPGHNQEGYCPECSDKVIFKSIRYGRKNITEFGRILWMQRRKSITYLQLDEYIIDYNKGLVPKVSFWPSAQYKFSAKEQHYYKHTPEGYWTAEYWKEVKNIRLPSAFQDMFQCFRVPRYQKTIMHYDTIDCIGTDLRYAQPHKYPDPYDLIQYIKLFLKWQSIELLEKAGFEKIVKDRVREITTDKINWRGKNLRAILKCTPSEMKKIKELNFGVHELGLYSRNKQSFPWINIEDSNTVSNIIGYREISKHQLEQIENPKKVMEYLLNQRERNIYVTLRDYVDYMNECGKLGYDLKRKEVQFPTSLRDAHAKTSELVQIEMDKHKSRLFKESQIRITGMKKPFVFGSYFIRPAESPEELLKESKALQHCVRTYTDKVARGDTSILFIRNIEEPDIPLYTLELSPRKKIVQCRGKHNCNYPEDVAKFIEEWEIQILKTKKKSKKGVAA